MPKKPVQKQFVGIRLNLLYPQGSEKKFYMIFLHWLITYGRFIIIFVELIVLLAFGLRFSYDAQLGDLKEDISKQVQVLDTLLIDEPRIVQTQKKLAFIKKSYASDPDWQQIFQQLSKEMPLTVRLTSIAVDKDPASEKPTITFRISAQTSSINDVGYFLKNIRENKLFKEVALQNISIEQGQIIFNIAGGIVK